MAHIGNTNGKKYTEEKVEEIFQHSENLLSVIENGKYKFCCFKEIEKNHIPTSKGFTYLVKFYPQYRKRMYDLILKAEANEKINNLIQIENEKKNRMFEKLD